MIQVVAEARRIPRSNRARGVQPADRAVHEDHTGVPAPVRRTASVVPSPAVIDSMGSSLSSGYVRTRGRFEQASEAYQSLHDGAVRGRAVVVPSE